MGRESQEKVIGKHRYRVKPLPPKQALRTLSKLSRMVGPALGAFADGVMAGDSVEAVLDMDTSDIKNLSLKTVVETLMGSFDHDDMEQMIDQLAKYSEVCYEDQGQKRWPDLDKVFDQHFVGNISGIFGWLFFALQVQYSDFFDGWSERLSSLGPLLQKRQNPSTSPSSSETSGLSGVPG